MEKRKNLLVTILISIIIFLCAVLAYGIYTGIKVKEEIKNLNYQINQLSEEKDILRGKYDLLINDVKEIYKGCIKENACKGRYPNVSWYCNNVGDEVSDYSHTCVCDSSCNLNATPISS